MTRVTQVLDYLMPPELFNWHMTNGKAKCQRISDESKKIGSQVDALIQRDIREGKYELVGEEPVKNCMNAWELFKKEKPWFVPGVAGMQEELTDGEILGHPDFYLELPDRWGIVDGKASRNIMPKYWTQTAKYFHLKRLTRTDSKPGFIAVLRLDKETGLFTYREIDDLAYIEYEIAMFDHYHACYKHAIENREYMRVQLEREVLGVA